MLSLHRGVWLFPGVGLSQQVWIKYAVLNLKEVLLSIYEVLALESIKAIVYMLEKWNYE